MNGNVFSYVVNRMLFLERDKGYTYDPSYKKSDIELADTAKKDLKSNRALSTAYFAPKKMKSHQEEASWEYGWKRLIAKCKWGPIAFDFGSAPGFHLRGIGVENPPGGKYKYTLNWIGPHEAYNKIVK